MKPALLFLVHRTPYPPNKGDKIRSYHLLECLSKRYRVYLGAFVDDAEQAAHAAALQCYCEEVFLVALAGRRARVRSLLGLLDGRPLTLPYYWNGAMASWVERKLAGGDIDRILAFSSSMAQYVMGERWAARKRVIDFVDVDSDKWRQYAPTRRWPMKWIYRREANKLLAFEREVVAEFDVGFFVSPHEAALFRQLAPEVAHKILHVNNGVDLVYYSPDVTLPNPYPTTEQPLVFVGAMDYWPNIDAVEWFSREVLPRLRARTPAVHFYIVGSNPVSRVRALAALDGVSVTGRVEDVRPYVLHATTVVVPLRIARGVQNKVLEAMALARPTVASPAALEGIEAEPGREVLVADDPAEFGAVIDDLLSGRLDGESIGRAARQRVERQYDWQRNLAFLPELLEAGSAEQDLKVAANDH